MTPAIAAIDVDLSAAVRVGDDMDLYFGISSRYFEQDPVVVRHWGDHYAHPDDLAVALFIADRSRCSLDGVYSRRRDGSDWWRIGMSCGVPVDAWFVPVERDPGPPYGKAYGYWKKHGRRHDVHTVPTDTDVRNLIAVRMMHDYYGTPVERAMDLRADGRDVRSLLTEEYRRRHNHAGSAAGEHPGNAKDKNKAKAKGKGKKER